MEACCVLLCRFLLCWKNVSLVLHWIWLLHCLPLQYCFLDSNTSPTPRAAVWWVDNEWITIYLWTITLINTYQRHHLSLITPRHLVWMSNKCDIGVYSLCKILNAFVSWTNSNNLTVRINMWGNALNKMCVCVCVCVYVCVCVCVCVCV